MQTTPTENTADGLYAMGHWLIEQGKIHDAAGVLRTLVTMAPLDERGYLALGVCHEHAEQPEIAMEIYGAAASLLERGARVRLARARLLLAAGERDDAIEAYDAAYDAALEDDELQELIAAERGQL